LINFLQSAFPSIVVREAAELASMGPQDAWTTTFDMLEPLGVTLTGLPPAAYAPAPPTAGPDFAIGLCTSGNPKHLNDRQRSLPAEVARRLTARLPGRIVDLHPKKSKAKDFAETAAIMAGLDLIVSVDTALGHLAGALDKTCLLLVPGFGTDWRWLQDRDDSPWYPRHRLFRSRIDGNWNDAIDALVAEVESLRSDKA